MRTVARRGAAPAPVDSYAGKLSAQEHAVHGGWTIGPGLSAQQIAALRSMLLFELVPDADSIGDERVIKH
jgi:hypothetical protein